MFRIDPIAEPGFTIGGIAENQFGFLKCGAKVGKK
jgi:hypothetical protein